MFFFFFVILVNHKVCANIRQLTDWFYSEMNIFLMVLRLKERNTYAKTSIPYHINTTQNYVQPNLQYRNLHISI